MFGFYNKKNTAHNTQYKTVGVQRFASICFSNQLFQRWYRPSPKTQPFHIVKRYASCKENRRIKTLIAEWKRQEKK